MFLAFAVTSGCDSPKTSQAAARLTLTGSSTCAPLISEIAERFEASHPGVRIDVQTGGSSRGIREAGTGLADIGMSSRALFDDELSDRAARVLARDGVCFLVHASNPVASLRDDQVKGILTGAIRNWRDVGGADAPITVIDRADGRSEVSLVRSFLDLDASSIRADAIAGENRQGIKQVASDPNAITYMSVGTAEYEQRAGVPIRLIALRGVEPSPTTVADGSYPLSRPLVLVTSKTEAVPSLVGEFLDYATSDAAADLIEQYSFVAARPAK